MSWLINLFKAIFGGKAEAPKQVAAPGESPKPVPAAPSLGAPPKPVETVPPSGVTSPTQSGSGSLLKGGDFSHYDPVTDWKLYAATGHAFAAAKISDGAGSIDSKGASQCAGSLQMGLPFVGYHFFRFGGLTPVEQAKLFYKAFGPLQKVCAIAADSEWDNVSGISRYANGGQTDAAGNNAFMTFVEEAEQLFGMGMIIYTGKSFMPMKDARFSSRKLWVFDWHTTGKNTPTVHDKPILPPSWGTWDLWQYSDSEQTSGAGRVDMNVFRGDATALAKLVRQ